MSLCKFTGFTVFPGSFRYITVLAVDDIVVGVVNCQFQPACVLLKENFHVLLSQVRCGTNPPISAERFDRKESIGHIHDATISMRFLRSSLFSLVHIGESQIVLVCGRALREVAPLRRRCSRREPAQSLVFQVEKEVSLHRLAIDLPNSGWGQKLYSLGFTNVEGLAQRTD